MNMPINYTKKTNILLAGAGGGFYFLCALPLALKLMDEGHNVFIANYSFTFLHKVENAKWISDEVLEVSSMSFIEEGDYFPEVYLARWFKEIKNRDVPIFCFPRLGVKYLHKAYSLLIQKHKINNLYVVDGGVDGIFRGDEYDLGTPSMDSISIIAGSMVDIEHKYYIFTAFGSEGVNKEVSTNMYWYFELDAVAKMKLFYEEVLNTDTVEEMSKCIDKIHSSYGNKTRNNIPI